MDKEVVDRSQPNETKRESVRPITSLRTRGDARTGAAGSRVAVLLGELCTPLLAHPLSVCLLLSDCNAAHLGCRALPYTSVKIA